jgi:hypothetical protein
MSEAISTMQRIFPGKKFAFRTPDRGHRHLTIVAVLVTHRHRRARAAGGPVQAHQPQVQPGHLGRRRQPHGPRGMFALAYVWLPCS